MQKKSDSDVGAEADGGATGLSLGRYAEVAAHVVHFRHAPEAEVLRRLHVRRTDWERARRHWSAAIGAELEEQETGLALTMGEPFLAERERLRREKPELESIGPDEVEAAAAAVPRRAAVIALEAPPAAPLPAAALLEPVPAPTAAPTAMPSFLKAGRSHAGPLGGSPPPVMSPPAPFVMAQPAAAVAPAVGAPSRPAAVKAANKGTVAAFEVPRGIGTPFSGRASDAEAIDSAMKHAEVAQPRREAAAAPVAIGETAMADDLAAVMKRVMPFGPGSSGPGVPAAPSPPSPQRSVAAAASPPGRPTAAPQAPPGRAPRAIGDWTLEQYASLKVEIAMAPADPGDVLRRYGLSIAERDELDARWRARFDSQPALVARFEQACQAYKAWLAGSRGSHK